MDTFHVIREDDDEGPGWVIEWHSHGRRLHRIDRRFRDEADAHRWAARLHELGGDGGAE